MSGYDNGDNSGWGGGSDNSESSWNSSGYNAEESGYPDSSSRNDNQFFAGQDSANFGSDSPLTTDFITDPYQENPFEVNPMDNAWSESLSNPNPHTDYSHPRTDYTSSEPEPSYQSYYGDSDGDQLQLEL